MPPLPNSRITKVSPFSNVGIDYIAPVFIKHQDSNRNAWVCLFGCMVTRALHMELVADMTAAEFLLDLISMLCSSVWHSNFSSVGQRPPVLDCWFISNNCLEGNSHGNRCYLFFSKNKIVWKIIIKFSPWMRDFYERLVGLVNRSMRKTIGRSSVDYNQLFTMCYVKFKPRSPHDHCYSSRAKSRIFSLPTPSSPCPTLPCCL